jgi:hypothetical protein
MSLVSSRVSLTHRCDVLRNIGSVDEWGAQDGTWEIYLAAVECRAWSGSGREVARDIETLVVEDRRLVVPLGLDITEADRISDVTYRGALIYEGTMDIEAVLAHADHMELVLKRVR